MTQLSVTLNLRIKVLMQLHGDIGILSRILRGPFNIHLVKINSADTLASHFIVANSLDAQMV